jgi:hypothetical protein
MIGSRGRRADAPLPAAGRASGVALAVAGVVAIGIVTIASAGATRSAGAPEEDPIHPA